jgi:hypothetical protein
MPRCATRSILVPCSSSSQNSHSHDDLLDGHEALRVLVADCLVPSGWSGKCKSAVPENDLRAGARYLIHINEATPTTRIIL